MSSSLLRKRKQIDYVVISDEDDDVAHEPTPSLKKHKPVAQRDVIDLTVNEPHNLPKKKTKGDKDKSRGKDEEKRLRRFRTHAVQSYIEIKARAMSQRLTVISRERCGTDEVPEEKVTMAGSTGNVYTQHIGHVPSCDCPHAKKGNQCKHIIYVMLRVLKAPEDIAYQLALTSSELQTLFKNAAPIPTDACQHDDDNDGNRKPIEGECPICYCDFEPRKEAIVYCKAACGNNVHKGCMQSWIASKGAAKATCPYCRAKWEDADFGAGFIGKADLNGAKKNREGYVNIAGQLGLSGERDYSSYHQPWAQRNYARYERHD